jgi:hypothetical protein
MLNAEKTTGKYLFSDLSPFNNDLRVEGTCDLSVFAITHLGIYPNTQVQSKNCLTLAWYKNLCGYTQVYSIYMYCELI